MVIKKLFFIMTILFSTNVMLSVDITKHERIKIICDDLIVMYETNKNIIDQDMLVSLMNDYEIESFQTVARLLEEGRDLHEKELMTLQNSLTSAKLSLFLTQISALQSALGCSHIYRASPLNYSQDRRNIFLNEFNNHLNGINTHLGNVNGHLDDMKYKYFIPMSKHFQLTVDSAIVNNQNCIINNNTFITNNETAIKINTITLSFYRYLELFTLIYVPLLMSAIVYTPFALYNFYKEYQLQQNLIKKINILSKVIDHVKIDVCI